MANLTIVSSIAYAYGTNGYTTTGTYPSTEVCKIGGGDGNRIRLTFPSLLTHPDCIGKNIRITSMFLALWRTDGTGGSFPITIKYSKGDRWDDDTGEAGAVHTSGKTEWNNCYSTNTAYGVPTVSNSNFYVHLSSTQTSSYANLSIGYTPHIYFYWEEVNGNFAGDATNTIGGTIGCNVPRGSSNERYTIYAQFGAENMVLCENVTPPTGTEPDVFVSVNAPLSYGLQIPDTSSGNVYLEAVCSVNGNITKRYFQNVPASFDSSTLQAPVIVSTGYQLASSIGDVAVGSVSSATIEPNITTYNGYGAKITSAVLTRTGDSSGNTSVSWTQAQLTLGATWVAAQYGYEYDLESLSLGVFKNPSGYSVDYTYTLTITDTRGATTTTTWQQTVGGYYAPRIKKFNVQRRTGSTLDPTGTNAMVTIDAEVYKIPVGTSYINSAEWALLVFAPGSTTSVFASYPAGSTASSIVYTQNYIDSSGTYYFALDLENDSQNLGDVTSTATTYAADKKYQCQLYLRDATGKVSIAYNEIPLGAPVMSLSGQKSGVAFGMLSTSTDTTKKLESAYPFYPYGGIVGMSMYNEKEEEVIGATWRNGEKVYKKSGTVPIFAPNTSQSFSLGYGITNVIKVEGFFIEEVSGNSDILNINWSDPVAGDYVMAVSHVLSSGVSISASMRGVAYITVWYTKTGVVITKQPFLTSRNDHYVVVTDGATVSLSITAKTSSGSLTYQWQYRVNGWTTWNDISGATSNTYSFTANRSTDNMNSYRCVATNSTQGLSAASEYVVVQINA